jgi:hypothetical protein
MTTVHRAWRWYFWISVALAALTLLFDAKWGFSYESFGELLYTVLGYIVEVLALVCLYGFAWQVRFGKQHYWAVFFFVNVLFFFSAIVYALVSKEFIAEMGLGFALSVLLLGTVLTLPMFVANFLYAFRNKQLWAASP